jgi:pilT protein domain protein
MIVIDASAIIQVLVGRDPGPALLDAVAGDLAAPHILDVEVLSALRGMVLGGVLPLEAAESARRSYADLVIDRYEAALLADRVWALRNQYTSYDAMYLALAEGLGAPLVTCDRKLDAGGHHVEVVVYA